MFYDPVLGSDDNKHCVKNQPNIIIITLFIDFIAVLSAFLCFIDDR